MNKAPIGNKILAENLSMKSKNVMSPKTKTESVRKLKVQNTPKNNATKVPIQIAVLRFIPCSSDKKATTTSSNDIVEVRAAIDNNMKNMIQKK